MADISIVIRSMMNHNPLMLSYRPSFTTVFSASSRVVLPVASLLVWGAVAFSAVTWGLRWSATGNAPSNATTAAQALPDVDVSAAARSLGAAPVQAVAAPTLAQPQGVAVRSSPCDTTAPVPPASQPLYWCDATEYRNGLRIQD